MQSLCIVHTINESKVTPVLGGTINKHADVKFESSNKAIARVGADGTIIAKKKGKDK